MYKDFSYRYHRERNWCKIPKLSDAGVITVRALEKCETNVIGNTYTKLTKITAPMKLTFIDPTVRKPKPVARIHASGKLGFNSDAAKFMNLEDLPSYVVAISHSEQGKFQIFFIDPMISDDIATPPPIRVAKAGKYYYAHFVNILNQLKIDYKRNKFTFDIEKSEYKGFNAYILTKREQKQGLVH